MFRQAPIFAVLLVIAACAQPDRPPRQPEVLPEIGFEPIFNGRSLGGWEGDPKLWRVEGNAIVGEFKERVTTQSSFLIWRGGKPADFELKLSFRVTGGGSGIQYRSEESGPWLLRGYQADLDGANAYTGQIWEERGRSFLAAIGQATYVGNKTLPGVTGTFGTYQDLTAWMIAQETAHEGWKELHIVARGQTLLHMIDGRAIAMTIDDDSRYKRASGLIGIQLQAGPPVRVEVRDIRLKELP